MAPSMFSSPGFRQVFVASGVLWNIFSKGYVMGYSSVLLEFLMSQKEGDFHASPNGISWIVSLPTATCALAFPVISVVMSKYGRKLSHILIILPNIIGCLVLYFAQSIRDLLIGRLFNGFNIGIAENLGGIIISEFSSPSRRGVLLNLKVFAYGSGILVSHVTGMFLDWRYTALVGLIPCILALIINCSWTESPAWLMSVGRFEECHEAFLWLRGNSEKTNMEYAEFLKIQKTKILRKKEITKNVSIVKLIYRDLTTRDFWKPMTVSLISYALLDFSARTVFPVYVVTILKEFTTDKMQIKYCVSLLDITFVISNFLSCFLVRRFKKRKLLFVSGISSVIVLIIFSSCVYYQNVLGNYPIVAVLELYFIVSNLGLSSISLSIIGEVYPLQYRSLSTCVGGILISFIVLITLKVTPHLMLLVGASGTFLTFAFLMVPCLVYLYFFLPETEGESLQNVENNFIKYDLVNNSEHALITQTNGDKEIA